MSCVDERYTEIRTNATTIEAISQNNRFLQFDPLTSASEFRSIIDRQRFQRRDHRLSIPPQRGRDTPRRDRGSETPVQLSAKYTNEKRHEKNLSPLRRREGHQRVPAPSREGRRVELLVPGLPCGGMSEVASEAPGEDRRLQRETPS
jgi:hypothetical protein